MKLRIKETAKKRGVLIKDLAAAVGVSPITVSGINSGRFSPSLKLLEKIAAALGVQVSELFEEDERPPVARCPHCGGSLEISLSPSSLSAAPQDEDAGE